MASNQWTCSTCTFSNQLSNNSCEMCGSQKQKATDSQEWSCAVCTFLNPISAKACNMCNAPANSYNDNYNEKNIDNINNNDNNTAKPMTTMIEWLKKQPLMTEYPLHCKAFIDVVKEQFDNSDFDIECVMDELNHFNDGDIDESEILTVIKENQNCQQNYDQYISGLIETLTSYTVGTDDNDHDDNDHDDNKSEAHFDETSEMDDNIQYVAFNTNWKQNKPLYQPTDNDKLIYKYNDKDGFLNAVMEELKLNVSSVTNYEGILQKVDALLELELVKSIKTLRRDHIFALVIWCDFDEPSDDIQRSQRNGNYAKWKWFDLLAYHAVALLSNMHTGTQTLYIPFSRVQMKGDFIETAYFKEFQRTMPGLPTAAHFMFGGGGMMVVVDAEFRKHAVCCDLSWLSKFSMEKEVIFARAISRSGAFQCKLQKEESEIQFIKLSHSVQQKINEYHNVVANSYQSLKKRIDNLTEQKHQINDNVFAVYSPDSVRKNVTVNVMYLSDSDDVKYDSSMQIEIQYSKNYTIKQLTNRVISRLEAKYNPVQFTLNAVECDGQFSADNIFQQQLDTLLKEPITNYELSGLNKIKLTMSISIYHHKVGNWDKITCPSMVNKNTNNPTYCAIYAKMKYQSDCSDNCLNHMQNYMHFVSDYEGKPKCEDGDNCKYYQRLQKGGNSTVDQCHMCLYIHPPRRRNITTKDGIHAFEVNKNIFQNQPLYKPTKKDEIKYKLNERDGYLNALIAEIIVNGQERELGDDDDGTYELMRAVDYKLNLDRHKEIGSPLTRGEMLSIICYTGTECYSEMTRCQRKGDFKTWQWFDYCLYCAIQKLGIREWGSYKLYSGHNGVRLNKKIIKNTFFKTYVSSSWMKFVAVSFASGEKGTAIEKKNKGMIMQVDPEFRESFGSICCDVSWISKFKNEYEVLIARGIDNTNNNFDMKVIDEQDGLQIVLLTKCTN